SFLCDSVSISANDRKTSRDGTPAAKILSTLAWAVGAVPKDGCQRAGAAEMIAMDCPLPAGTGAILAKLTAVVVVTGTAPAGPPRGSISSSRAGEVEPRKLPSPP